MPYLFECPHCQAQTKVNDGFSGHQGECIECRGEIVIPHFTALPHGVLQHARKNASGYGSSRNAPTRLTGRLASFVGASLAVCAIAVLLFIGVYRVGGRSMARIAEARSRAAAVTNLEKIALALNNYAADHGTYPPPIIRNAVGKPMHSWRVLLLPYLGENEVYNTYNQSLPWDDPTNLSLQWEVPRVYLHPNSGAGGWSAQAAFYLITGPGTLFPPSGPLGPSQIADRASQTILVAEGDPVASSASWLEPLDLNYGSMSGDLLAGGTSEIGGLSNKGATVATADGRGHFIDETISPTTLQSLITPNGGEPLADDVLD